MGLQWRFFHKRIRLNTHTLIIYASTTEKPRQTNRTLTIYAVSCDYQMFRQKNCRLALCSKRCFLSRSVKTIYGSPCCSHQATTVHAHVMGNRRGNMATKPRTTSLSTDRSRETLWLIIIRGNSVLYFRSNGKAKNKLPVGGRL